MFSFTRVFVFRWAAGSLKTLGVLAAFLLAEGLDPSRDVFGSDLNALPWVAAAVALVGSFSDDLEGSGGGLLELLVEGAELRVEEPFSIGLEALAVRTVSVGSVGDVSLKREY